MSSIEATPAPGEAARPPVPVKHPRWCDRSRCTAPEFVPTKTEAEGGAPAGAHHSVNLVDFGASISPDWRGDREMYLSESCAPWPTNTWLYVGNDMIMIDHSSPLMWALFDVYEEIKAQYPDMIKQGRADAAKRVAAARAKEARRGVSE